MSVDSPDELRALRASGRVVAATIRAMRRAVRPCVTTAELDEIARREFARAGARSGPQLDYGFPGVTALSQPLTKGLVITIEPLVAAGGSQVRLGRDGWTVRTADGSLSAHAEHTIMGRDGAPLVLTA